MNAWLLLQGTLAVLLAWLGARLLTRARFALSSSARTGPSSGPTAAVQAVPPARIEPLLGPTFASTPDCRQQHPGLLRRIRERSRFSRASFERDLLPLVDRVAAVLAQAPASADAPSLRQLLQWSSHALALRQGQLLPPGAAVEDLEPRAYRWTLALVLMCMLLPLRASGVLGAPADDEASPELTLRDRLQAWLHPQTLDWLLEDDVLCQTLLADLQGTGRASVLVQLVRRGQQAAARASAAGEALPGWTRERSSPTAAPMPTPTPTPPRPAFEQETEAMVFDLLGAPQTEPPADPPTPPAAAAPAPAAPSGAQDFIAWLDAELQAGRLNANEPGALVHRLSEGLVLVMPELAQRHAQAMLGPQALPMDLTTQARQTQRLLVAQGWHAGAAQGAPLHRFAPVESPGQPVRGLLLPQPQALLRCLPATGRSLTRVL